jgi:hypothetical protein
LAATLISFTIFADPKVGAWLMRFIDAVALFLAVSLAASFLIFEPAPILANHEL